MTEGQDVNEQGSSQNKVAWRRKLQRRVLVEMAIEGTDLAAVRR